MPEEYISREAAVKDFEAPLSGGCYDCKKYMLPYCRPNDFCGHGDRKEDLPCES